MLLGSIFVMVLFVLFVTVYVLFVCPADGTDCSKYRHAISIDRVLHFLVPYIYRLPGYYRLNLNKCTLTRRI